MTEEKDKILDLLIRTAQAISQTFGSSCETLVHDMAKPGHPIVAIFNPQVSGRKVGSTMDIFGDVSPEELAGKEYNFINEDAVNTFVITNSGKCIKSTTIHCKGNNYHYALGINFDYTDLIPALGVMQDLTKTEGGLDEHLDMQRSNFMGDDFSLCLEQVGRPIESMKKRDKLKLVSLLMDRNFFDLQKSVSFVAEQLGVSRYTVYKYIHEVEDFKGK